MAGITSAIAASWKSEAAFMAGHCFAASGTFTATMASGAVNFTAASSLAGTAVGMPITATSVQAGTILASITGPASGSLSLPATAAIAAGTFSYFGDTFKLALIKFTPTGTYGSGSVNYSDLVGNADEVSGAGYTAGGVALTNVGPALAAVTSWTTFNNSPATSWTSATIDSGGCEIYNTASRLGGTSGTNASGANRVAAVFAFPGEEKVTAGTFTITYPSTANGLLSVT